MQNLTPENRAAAILFRHAHERMVAAQKNGGRFVHYSTAETARNILANREVWMRKASMMNDFLEIDHGFTCVTAALAGGHGKRFRAVLDRVSPELAGDIERSLPGYRLPFRENTFLTCLSEHGAESP